MADVSDPQIREIIEDVRSDATETNWCAIGYAGKAKLEYSGSGTGGHAELMEFLDDSKVHFCLLRMSDGDRESMRIKFVALTFVGENVGGMARGRVGVHTGSIRPLFGQCNIDLSADNVKECSEAIIRKKLKVAGGADYDTGANAGGYKSNASEIRRKALAAYSAKEKEGNIKKVTYVTSALPATTPVDLSGRKMVANASDARKNTKDTILDTDKFKGKATTASSKTAMEFEDSECMLAHSHVNSIAMPTKDLTRSKACDTDPVCTRMKVANEYNCCVTAEPQVPVQTSALFYCACLHACMHCLLAARSRKPTLSNKPKLARKPSVGSKPKPAATKLKPATSKPAEAPAVAKQEEPKGEVKPAKTEPEPEPATAPVPTEDADKDAEAPSETETGSANQAEEAGVGERKWSMAEGPIVEDPEERRRLRAEARKARREEAAAKAKEEARAIKVAAMGSPLTRRRAQPAGDDKADNADNADKPVETEPEPEEVDVDQVQAEPEPEPEPEPVVEAKTEVVEAEKKAAKKKKHSLFDDEDEDEDDLFASKPRTTTAAPAKKGASLFDDDDDEDLALNGETSTDEGTVEISVAKLRAFLKSQGLVKDGKTYAVEDLVALIDA
eukprot:TRINITY_DN11251_c0_g1_i5.p1 TRINITY_DN11251_c0_g1~~TRINITY_DN11251_c0_g1_i5.p1  ORF type:complete len:616 (+),score=200.94 TRINITY_DN11251_c0_g1_i5:85-1932(+)